MYFIYLIKAEETSRYKIGVSKNPKKRIKQNQTGNSEQLTLVVSIQVKYPYKVEKSLHNVFSHKKVNGEWFDLSLEDELNFIEKCKKIEKNIDFLKQNNNFFI